MAYRRKGQSALRIVRKFYPKVNVVEDATEYVEVEVTKRDNESATVRNHKGCAMAVACKRKEHADGVLISSKTAYIIKGDKALRYKVPESVGREVTSFDRGAEFAPGEYRLKPPVGVERLGEARGGNTQKTGRKPMKMHHTEKIRTALGSKIFG